jgi:hypothetical protein
MLLSVGATRNTIDVHRALATMAGDPDVKTKIEIGIFVVAAPVVGIAAVGYQVALARQVAAGEAAGLPAWDDVGHLFRQGFWLALARLLYELPARLIVLAALLWGVRGLWLAGQASEALWPGPALHALRVFGLGGLVAGLYSLAYGFLSPALTAVYAQRGTLRACFDLRAMVRLIARQPRAYLKLWVVREALGLATWLAGLGLGFVAGLLPVVGPLAGTMSWGWLLFVSLLLNGCLVGQLLQAGAARQLYPPAPAAVALPAGEA